MAIRNTTAGIEVTSQGALSSLISAGAVFLNQLAYLYNNFPSMSDSPTGTLSFWIEIQSQAWPNNNPPPNYVNGITHIPWQDFVWITTPNAVHDIFGNGNAAILTGPAVTNGPPIGINQLGPPSSTVSSSNVTYGTSTTYVVSGKPQTQVGCYVLIQDTSGAGNVIGEFQVTGVVYNSIPNTTSITFNWNSSTEFFTPSGAVIYYENNFVFNLANVSSGDSYNAIPETPIPVGVWTNVLMSWNTNFAARSKVFQLYYGDTAIALAEITDASAAFNVSYSQASTGSEFWAVGGTSAGSTATFDAGIYACLAEFWFAPGQFIDFTIPANRLLFHTAAGAPQNLGSTGSTPTGTPPAVYLSLPFNDGTSSDFAINRAGGSNLTIASALTLCQGSSIRSTTVGLEILGQGNSPGTNAGALAFNQHVGLYNFPSMTDSSTGSLSFWVEVPKVPSIPVFDAGPFANVNITWLTSPKGVRDIFTLGSADTCILTGPTVGIGVTIQQSARYTYSGAGTSSHNSSGFTYNSPTGVYTTGNNFTVAYGTTTTITLAGFGIPARAGVGADICFEFSYVSGGVTFIYYAAGTISSYSYNAGTDTTTIVIPWNSTGFGSTWNPTLSSAEVQLFTENTLQITLTDTSANEFVFDALEPLPQGFTNVLISWNTNFASGSKVFNLYYGDTAISALKKTDSSPAFNVHYNQTQGGSGNPPYWCIGWYSFPTGPKNGFNYGITGCLAEFWFAPGQFIDFTIAGNRRKFNDGNGNPVVLGSTGAIPTGTSPTVYLSLGIGDTNPLDFALNRSGLGNLTINNPSQALLCNANFAKVSTVGLEVIGVPTALIPPCPIGLFPSLPGLAWPTKRTQVFSTPITVGFAGREIEAWQPRVPTWKFNLVFDFLRDATQNQVPYAQYSALTELQQIESLFTWCCGTGGSFYFADFYDQSRTGIEFGVGDGATRIFTLPRETRGVGGTTTLTAAPSGMSIPVASIFGFYIGDRFTVGTDYEGQITNLIPSPPTIISAGNYSGSDTTGAVVNDILIEPIGGINTNFTTTIFDNGTPVSSGNYTLGQRTVTFNTAPVLGHVLTASFYFYYLCHFIEDQHQTEEFMANLWRLGQCRFENMPLNVC